MCPHEHARSSLRPLDSSLARTETIELGKYLVDKPGKLGRLHRLLNGKSLFEFIENRNKRKGKRTDIY